MQASDDHVHRRGKDAAGLVATTPRIKLYLAGALYPLIGAYSPWSNLCASRQLFGDKEQIMGKINERCAGIDVGKRFLLCCVLTGSAYEEPRSPLRRAKPWFRVSHTFLRDNVFCIGPPGIVKLIMF